MSRQAEVGSRLWAAVRGLERLFQNADFADYYSDILAGRRVNAPSAKEAWSDYRSSVYSASLGDVLR